MMLIKNQVKINCPIEKAFSFISKPENFPKWNYYIKSVNKIGAGSPVIGATYHQEREKDDQYYVITGFEENKSIEFSSIRSYFFKYKRWVTFSPVAEGCVIIDIFEIRTWLPSFINKQIARKPQMAVRENLFKLKELLESGETILQDGRKVLIE